MNKISGMESKKRTVIQDHVALEEKFLESLLLSALQDASELLGLDLARDIEVVRERVKAEGFSFISKTLPRFYKHILSSLETRNFAPTAGFRRYIRKGGRRTALPSFIPGLLAYFFTDDGALKEPSSHKDKAEQAEVLKIVEQICTGFGSKYEFRISDKQFNKQMSEAISIEAKVADMTFLDLAIGEGPGQRDLKVSCWDLRDVSNPVKLTTTYSNAKHWRMVQRRATTLCHKIMEGFDPFSVIPRHGPGAVYDPIDKPHEKYNFDISSRALDFHYPFAEYFTANPGVLDVVAEVPGVYHYRVRKRRTKEFTPRITRLGSEPYIPSLNACLAAGVGGMNRATLVNKNAEKGRQINMEGKEIMWIQKGVQNALYEWLLNHPMLRVPSPYREILPFRGKPLRGPSCINFDDQSLNGRLAQISSSTREYATLDFSSASTYVSTAHVARLFPDKNRDVFLSLRSEYVVYKNKAKQRQHRTCTVVKSKTYAPMGSAVCFPTEALVFYCYAKAALELEGCTSPVFVYGDDVLVPTRHAEKIIECMEHFGFVVNKNKTFIHGHFRESCGVNAYNGIVCTAPCRVKKRMSFRARKTEKIRNGLERSEAAASFVAWVDYSNILYQEGFPGVAAVIRKQLRWSYPKEYDHLVNVRRITGHEGYLVLLDYNAPAIKTQTREQSSANLLKFNTFVESLEQSGITLSEVTKAKLYKITLPVEYQQHYLRGVSLETTRYELPPDHPSFPDELAYLRALVEQAENSRSFSLRNQCRLKTSWHTL